jgi:hypothetical protein
MQATAKNVAHLKLACKQEYYANSGKLTFIYCKSSLSFTAEVLMF